MKNRRYMLAMALLALVGCVVDKYPDDPTCQNYVVVKSFDEANNDITSIGAVDEVSLYVIDDKGAVIQKVDGFQNQPIPILIPNDSVKVVVWGNAKKMNIGPQGVNLSIKGKIGDTKIAESPADLFWGVDNISWNEQSATIAIRRKTAAVNIKALNIASGVNDKFEFVVNQTQSRLNFDGHLVGDSVSYTEQAQVKGNQAATRTFRTFASSEPISVNVLLNGVVIYTAYTDYNGASMFVENGKLTVVVIDFGMAGNVEVSVDVLPWDDKWIDQEF